MKNGNKRYQAETVFCAHSGDSFQIQKYHSVTCGKKSPYKSVQHGSTAAMILAFLPVVASELFI